MTRLRSFLSATILKRDHAPSLECGEGVCTQLTVGQSYQKNSYSVFSSIIKQGTYLTSPAHQEPTVDSSTCNNTSWSSSTKMAPQTWLHLGPSNQGQWTLHIRGKHRCDKVKEFEMSYPGGRDQSHHKGSSTWLGVQHSHRAVAQQVQDHVSNDEYYQNKAKRFRHERGRLTHQRQGREDEDRRRGRVDDVQRGQPLLCGRWRQRLNVKGHRKPLESGKEGSIRDSPLELLKAVQICQILVPSQ